MRASHGSALGARWLQSIALAAVSLASASPGAAPLWRTPWMLDAPPRASLQAQGTTRGLDGIAFAADGDILLGTQGFYGYQDAFISRISTDGTLRWNGVVHAWDPPAAIVPLPDGGAYATFATPFLWGGFAARLDANGNTLWARDVPARALVPIDAGRAAISDCEALSMLDAASGVVLWSRTLSTSGNCGGDGLIVDGSTIYAFGLTFPGNETYIPELAAYSLDGTFRWQIDLDIETSFSTFPSFMGLSAGRLYVRSDEETIAIDVANGTIVWRVPNGGVLLAGAAHEPIASTPDGLERLAATDGHVLWAANIGSHVTPVAEVGGAIVAVAGDTLYRIDPESGETTWAAPLPAVDPGAIRYWTAIGGLAADGTFSLAGHTNFQPFVQRVDFGTGALGASLPAPAFAQGVYGASVRDGSDLLGYRFDPSDVLRVIDVDANTGAVRWNAATPLGDDQRALYAFTDDVQIAIGPTRVAAAVPLTDHNSTNPAGFVEVAAYDRADGSLAWTASLADWLAGETDTSVSTPVVDAAGNVIVSVGMMEQCGQGLACPKHSIYKLAAADGSVLWRVDDDLYGATDAKRLVALGDDALVYGPFEGSSATLRRLSGTDGSVAWESDVFAPDSVANVYRSGDSRLTVFPLSADAMQWDALDAATGAIVWANTAPCDVNANCHGSDGIVRSTGRLVLPMQPGANASLVDLALDGSGTTATWPLAPASPNLYTYLWGLDEDDDGTIGFVLQRYGTMVSSGLWAGRLAPNAPSNVSYQRIAGLPLGGIASATLPLETTTFGARPTGSEFSLEDMAIAATGNLAATVTLDRDVVSPGSYVGFRLSVTYAGDAPISGAELRGNMPWPSGAIDVTCSGNGISNCALDTTGRDVVATFDIAPGGTLEVSGRILVLDFGGGGAHKLGARVVGPPALNESDTIDNFAFATFAQALFANGFD
jgi:hypothetical protein